MDRGAEEAAIVPFSHMGNALGNNRGLLGGEIPYLKGGFRDSACTYPDEG